MDLEDPDEFDVDDFERQVEFLEEGLGKDVDEEGLADLLGEMDEQIDELETTLDDSEDGPVLVPVEYHSTVKDMEMFMVEEKMMIPADQVLGHIRKRNEQVREATEELNRMVARLEEIDVNSVDDETREVLNDIRDMSYQ